MASILVAYATTEGQTRRIAEYAADRIRQAGHTARLVDAAGPPGDLAAGGAEGILFLASIHVGRHSEAAYGFVAAHRTLLGSAPAGFLSVSLSAASAEKRAEAQGYVESFLEETGWRPALTGTVAGALRYREYGLAKRLLLMLIAWRGGLPTDTSRDHEFTDWSEVNDFVADLLRRVAAPLGAVPSAVAARGAS